MFLERTLPEFPVQGVQEEFIDIPPQVICRLAFQVEEITDVVVKTFDLGPTLVQVGILCASHNLEITAEIEDRLEGCAPTVSLTDLIQKDQPFRGSCW